jgi:hypothetical protein
MIHVHRTTHAHSHTHTHTYIHIYIHFHAEREQFSALVLLATHYANAHTREMGHTHTTHALHTSVSLYTFLLFIRPNSVCAWEGLGGVFATLHTHTDAEASVDTRVSTTHTHTSKHALKEVYLFCAWVCFTHGLYYAKVGSL